MAVLVEHDLRGRGERFGASDVYKLRCHHQDKNERSGTDHQRPETFAAGGPLHLALLCLRCCRSGLGPANAISCLLERITPVSESSCNPVMTSCAATKSRMIVVTRKKRRRSMRTLPFTNITPNTTANATPRSVPRKLISSVELSDTPCRITTVSRPSRKTMRKTNKKSPQREPVLASV